MTKARDLANFVSTGNPLADGTLAVADISDLTASAAELNVLDGVTASTAELNYVDGVTSGIQTQLDAKASLTGEETLTNKTLTDPKISLGGSNGTSGQALVSQGAGVAPAWGSVSSVITKTYTNRADLRSVNGPATLLAVVESLGVFAWESGSTQVDDDETCFATASGRWLLYAAAWDLVYEYIVGELDILGEIRPIYDTVYNSNTSIGALSSIQITKVVTGAELTDAVIVNPVLPLATGNDGSVTYSGAVTAANQVTVNIGNASASSRNLTVGNLKIIVVKGNP